MATCVYRGGNGDKGTHMETSDTSQAEKWSLSSISAPCLYVFFYLIGQWTRSNFVSTGHDVIPEVTGFELPFILLVIEIFICSIFLKIKTGDGMQEDIEGVLVSAVCHAVSVTLMTFWFTQTDEVNLVPISTLAPFTVLVLNYVCSQENYSLFQVCMSIMVSCGAILFTTQNVYTDSKKDSIIIFVIAYASGLRDILFNHFQPAEIKVHLRIKTITSFVSVLMLLLFLSSMVVDTKWTRFVSSGVFCAILSTLIVHLTPILLQREHSVVLVSFLTLWGQVLSSFVLKKDVEFREVLEITEDRTKIEYDINVRNIMAGILTMLVGGVLFVFSTNHEYQDEETGLPRTVRSPNKADRSRLYARVETMLFAGLVGGIFLYAFCPHINHRHLELLQTHPVYNESTI